MAKQKIRIRLKAYDHRILDKSAVDIVNTAKQAGGKVSGPVMFPTRIRKYTVLRSPHIDKKSRDQFEMRIYKRFIKISALDSQVIDSLMKLSLPPGVDVRISLKEKGA